MRRRPRRRRAARRRRSSCAQARSWRSPASPATASASSPRRSRACGRPHGRQRSGRGRELRAGDAARRDPRRASRTCRRTGCGTGVSPGLSIASNVVLKSYRGAPASRRAAARASAPIRELRRAPDRALRRRGAGPRDAGAPALGRQPAEGRAGARVRRRSRACSSRPRRREASTSAASRRCSGYLREAAAAGVGVLLISEDLDEILDARRPHRRDLRGRVVGEVRRGRRPPEEIGLLMAGRRAREAPARAAARSAALARRRRARRLARRRVRARGHRPARHRARPAAVLPSPLRYGLRRGRRRSRRDADRGDAAALHGTRRGRCVPHEPVQHRCRGPALLRARSARGVGLWLGGRADAGADRRAWRSPACSPVPPGR